MKPSIHFMWVPSDGKKPSHTPIMLALKSLKNEVTHNTLGSLGLDAQGHSDCFQLSFLRVAIIFMCLCAWEQKQKTGL